MALLLAACTQNSGSSPTPTLAPASVETLPSESAMMSETPSSATTASCAQAFADLSPSDLSSMTSLSDVQATLDTTFAGCQTVEDWTSAAQTVLPSVDLSGAETFIKDRCQANTTLANTPLCTAVSS